MDGLAADFDALVDSGAIEPVGVDSTGEARYRLTTGALPYLRSERLIAEFLNNTRRTRREMAALATQLRDDRNELTLGPSFSISMMNVDGKSAPLYVLDLRHFPRKSDRFDRLPDHPWLDELLAAWGQIVALASGSGCGLPVKDEAVRCWEVPWGDTRCDTPLTAVQLGPDIVWSCSACHTTGVAQCWQGTIWDAQASHEATHDPP